MPMFESLEVKANELPRPVISPAAAQGWLPALTTGQTAAVLVLVAVWLLRGLLPLETGPLWAQAAAGKAIVEQAATSSWPQTAAAARAVGVGWLGDLALFGAWAAAGDEGLVLLQTALVTLACGLLLVTLRARRLGWGPAAGVTAAAALGMTLGLPAGCAWFSLVGLATLGWLLAGIDRRRTHWLLPALFVVWANLDSGYLLGLGWLAAWTAGQAIDRLRGAGAALQQDAWPWAGGVIGDDPRGGRQRSAAQDVFVFALCVLACAAQPLGWAGLSAAWERLAGSALPLGFPSWAALWFLLTVACVAVLLRTSPRRIAASEALAASLAATAALWSATCLSWWAVAWAWAGAPHEAALGRSQGRVSPVPEAGGVKALSALAAVFVALTWSPPGQFLLTGRPRPVGQIMAAAAPLALAAEIEERQPAGAAFFAPQWADYLTWRGGGRLVPLVNSLLPSRQGVWRDAAAIAAASHGWLEIADHYGLRYLIASRQSTPELAGAVQREKRCRVLYQDQQGLLVELRPATPVDQGPSASGTRPGG
jgi:hypothetical protein